MNTLRLNELAVDVVEFGGQPREGMIACRLGKNIKFDSAVLESFSTSRWQPVVYDALVVAAAVEFCDRSLARSKMTWGRRFSLRIPVHDPYRWSDKAVVRTLVEALNLLTGDDWNFEFYVHHEAMHEPAQHRMDLPPEVEAVIAFSDGMDSRAVAGIERRRLGHRLVCVRVGTAPNDVSRKERRQMLFAALPYAVRLDDGRNAESSARSRGFKFGVVSAIAAYLTNAPSAIMPESGQGALAPALLPVGQAYEDYRNHPVFTVLMEKFIAALFGHPIRYTFPRLWTTKAETLREFVDSCEDGAKWIGTRSCWQQSRQAAVTGSRRQCGICAACILRRLSVHAAGLAEPPKNYVWESLQASSWEAGASSDFKNFTPALREYAIAGVLHFEHLASITGTVQYDLIKRRKSNQLASALAQEKESVLLRLDRMLKQHTLEWSAFKDDLGEDSFVRKWIDKVS